MDLDRVTVDDLWIHDVTGIGYSKHFLRPRGTTHNVLIEDVDANSGRQSNDKFAAGIQIGDTAYNFTIRRMIARNSSDVETSGFWNGDGFIAERGNHGIQVIDSEAYENTDADFDFKSFDTWFTRPKAAGNKETTRCGERSR